jgi:hypothetical protein
MAKIRRILRKVESRGDRFFDEQLWPVNIAVVVLGGFLMGVAAAYGRFSGVPWYLNAWLALVSIPICVAAVLVAFQYIDNRMVRRSLQLSIVVAAILHVAMIVQLVETRIFAQMFDQPGDDLEIVESRPKKIIPEYHPTQLVPEEDRPQQDFERPVETQTPEPTREPEQIVRQPTEEPRSPPEPQPVPVPESVNTTEPNVVRRQRPNEAAPRQAEQASKLSRQVKPSEARTSGIVEAVQAATQPTAGVESRPSTSQIARQQTEATPTTRANAEPTTTTESRTPQLARRTQQQAPMAETSATPTLRREVAQAVATPRTQVAAAEAPSPARETSPTEVAPANTTAIKRATTSPQIAQATVEPTPEVTTEPAAQPERRQAPSPEQPTVAAAPTPTPNRQERVTSRPDVATTAAVAAPTQNPASSSTSVAELAPRASSVARTATEVTAAQPSAMPATTPQSAVREQPAARIARSGGRESPAATPEPSATPTLSRRTGAPSLPSVAQTAEAPAATTSASSATSEISPTSTATRRQATTSPQAAPASGEPRAAQVASAATTPTTTPAPLRRAATGSATSDSPVVSSTASATPTASRSTQSAVANVVTTVGDVPTNAGAQTAAASSPGPSSAAVSRQTAAMSPGATRTQAPAAVPSAGPTASVASGGATRAQSSQIPTIDPSGNPSGTPQRAVAAAATAGSPTAVESPAASVATAGAGDPAASPARLALSRSLAGVAGAGRSPNVDSSMPGGASPALVASGAARRAESTQESAPGAALSPAAPAQVARSQSGANLPTATVRADDVEVANVAGGAQVAEVTASASAALTRADANATQGEVTGAKGTGEVDLGPTQVVAESGVGRASGGGQAELNFQTQSPQLARTSATGGAPQMALAAPTAAEVSAPAGTAGGAPMTMQPAAAALATVRSTPGGQSADSGGPSVAQERGPLEEANTAALLADSPLSRADNADGQSGGEAGAGEPGVEDEEEKARRLARAALGGGPQLAVAGPVVAEAAASPMGAGGDGGTPNPDAAAAAQLAMARQNRDGGAPAGGAPLAAGQPDEGGSAGGEIAGNLTIARAEAAESAPGAPAAGGGTSSPTRKAAGATFAASTVAEQVAMAGAPASGGEPDGAPLAAQGVEAARLAGGATGPVTSGAVGAVAGPEVVDTPRIGAVGDATGRRQASPATEDGPAVGAIAFAGAPGQRATATEIAGGSTNVADIPEVGPTSAVAQAELDHMMPGIGQTPMIRQSGDALAADVEAPAGPGGLGADYTPEVGINTRQARADSLNVQLRSARFVKTQVGGLPSVNTAAIVSADAFSSRGSRARGELPGGGKGAPSPQTEEAIERGLAFLARYQGNDGGWSLQGFPEGAQLVSDTAATAMAVIAFQGGGYTHRELQYKDVVRAGLDHLIQSQKENGDLFVPLDDASNRSVWLYSHSLATIALCEAYGMTQDPELREPAQKALDFIVAAQHAERGGWRYSPGVSADTSVSGWMVVAMRTGELAGLEVPTEPWAKVSRWLDDAQQSKSQPHLYRYNPHAPDTDEQRHGRTASKTMTSVGLLMRLYTGWKRDNPNMIRGADFLLENPPALGTPREPQRDTYYWYYATLVMSHMGGDRWKAWNDRLHPLLVNSQVRQGTYAGSWDPKGPIPDRWGPHAGRIYVTAMNLLSLEVQYRKLKLYEETVK